MALRDLLLGTEQATKADTQDFDAVRGANANIANVAKVEQTDDRTLATLAILALAKTRNPKTGEMVPRLLAMVKPVPGDEFQARLDSFRSKKTSEETFLVDILCSVSSGGMKGLTFRLDQL